MENKNEKDEMVTLDEISGEIIEQFVGLVDEKQEKGEGRKDEEGEYELLMPPDDEIVAPVEDDATMKVLKQYPKVCERIAELMRQHAESAALEVLQKGVDYDEAVANADKEAYLRGKNEKIVLVKNHRMNRLDELSEPKDSQKEPTLFPRYEKRSVWEQ